MSESPWLTLRAAAVYASGISVPRDDTDKKPRLSRSPRFLAREIKAGRLRAAIVGGRREYVLRREWVTEWLEAQARPVEMLRRRA